MKVKISKLDKFIDYMQEQGRRDVETSEVVEDLDAIGFWTDRELERAVLEWKCRDVNKLMRKLPKHNGEGEGDDLERVHVTRPTRDGGLKDVYALRLNLTADDTIQAVESYLERGNHFFAEARRLHDLALVELPKKEAAKVRSHFKSHRVFQGLLEIEGIDEEE